jgi:hypothetical protein
MPLITTIVSSDLEEQKNFSPIVVNDVIETHKFLKKFHGGFEEMFKTK